MTPALLARRNRRVRGVQTVGACLEEDSPDVLHAIFYELRRILQEGRVPKRTQYQIETLMATRKAGFEASGHPALKPELDLVEDDDKVTHDQVRVVRAVHAAVILIPGAP